MTDPGQTGLTSPGATLQDILKGFVTGLVIAMIVVAGQLVAGEKGRADPELAASLCISGTLVMWTPGEDGTPDGPAHICPDALLVALGVATPKASFGGWRLALDHGAPVEAARFDVIGPQASPPPARAPPVLV